MGTRTVGPTGRAQDSGERPPPGGPRTDRSGYLSRVSVFVMAAWAAASRATGTRKGEQLT
jgi:hypothetical protein